MLNGTESFINGFLFLCCVWFFFFKGEVSERHNISLFI